MHGRDGKPACYGLRNNFLLPNVIKGANFRLEASLKPDFVDKMVEAIHRKHPLYFRVHASGDFYSEEYVGKWIQIAKKCPDTIFRTTTRRRDLTNKIKELNSLPNFIVRESLDYERPIPKMGLSFAALDSLPIVQEKNPYVCKDDCPKCGYFCWEMRVNMSFKEV